MSGHLMGDARAVILRSITRSFGHEPSERHTTAPELSDARRRNRTTSARFGMGESHSIRWSMVARDGIGYRLCH
jgi:hypothetical protein